MTAPRDPSCSFAESAFTSDRSSRIGPSETPGSGSQNSTAVSPQQIPVDRRDVIRSGVESIACLLLAVILFRTFAAEGYIISTGSMAPNLLGFHKRVDCPRCGYVFPFGTAWDTDEGRVSDNQPATATCPNCRQREIDVTSLPRNHGDQLLVNKSTLQFRSPQRWESWVFRNPAKPTEAYVKRIVGLPKERIQIFDGDVYANGQICRKNLTDQYELRIPVIDQRSVAPLEHGDSPWTIRFPEQAANGKQGSGKWKQLGTGFSFHPGSTATKDPVWLEYRQRCATDLKMESRVSLANCPDELFHLPKRPTSVKFDPSEKTVSATGPVSEQTKIQLMSLSENAEYRDAMQSLYQLSQAGPVTDEYGYNAEELVHSSQPVRDLMLSAMIQFSPGAGTLFWEMTDGHHVFRLIIDPVAESFRLMHNDGPRPVRSGPLPRNWRTEPFLLEMSLFDQQVLVGVNREIIFPAWEFETPSGTMPLRCPLRMGATGISVQVRDCLIYRDVYYLSKGRHAVNAPCHLQAGQYFVLGDNSPLSHDSRAWSNPAVDEELLLGKPFLLHLPSKPAFLSFAGQETQIRVPDVSRMRFLR